MATLLDLYVMNVGNMTSFRIPDYGDNTQHLFGVDCTGLSRLEDHPNLHSEHLYIIYCVVKKEASRRTPTPWWNVA